VLEGLLEVVDYSRFSILAASPLHWFLLHMVELYPSRVFKIQAVLELYASIIFAPYP